MGANMITAYSTLQGQSYLASDVVETPLEKDLEKAVPEVQIFKVAPASIRKLEKELRKFNKFLTKQNLPLITYNIDPNLKEEVSGRTTDESGESVPKIVYYKELKIESNPLQNMEWEHIGTKEPVGGKGTQTEAILLKNPNYKGEIPKSFDDKKIHCQHCNTSHTRTKSYILRHKKDGRMLEVGGSCLQYYMGNLNLAKYDALWQKMLEGIDEEMKESRSNSKVDAINIENFLAHVIGLDLFYHKPYLSKKNIPEFQEEGERRKIPTSEEALTNYFLKSEPRLSAVIRNEIQTVEDTYLPKAEEVIKWFISEYPKMAPSEFLEKLKMIVDNKFLNPKLAGFVAYLYPMWKKAHEVKEDEKTPKKPAEWVGNIGDKVTLNVTVVRTISYDSQYGTGYFHMFKDENGNSWKWSTGQPLDYNQDMTGQKAILKGTIKGHDEYKGNKQNIITRCKVEFLGENSK